MSKSDNRREIEVANLDQRWLELTIIVTDINGRNINPKLNLDKSSLDLSNYSCIKSFSHLVIITYLHPT